MILTKEELDEYRSELPRSVWNKRCLTNFLDTIADLESRLKAATEKLDCGHPKMFWCELAETQVFEDGTNVINRNSGLFHCTICAEIQAAYERGLRYVAQKLSKIEYWRMSTEEIKTAILAQKDRGAK